MMKSFGLKFLASLAVCLGFFTPCFGEAHPEGWRQDWQCGQEIKLTKELVDALEPSYVSQADRTLPNFVIGSLRRPSAGTDGFWDYPTILLTKNGDAWRAFPLVNLSQVFKVMTDPDSGNAMIFTMLSAEAPAQDYNVISTVDGFKTIRCGYLPAPAIALQYSEFMEIGFIEKGPDKTATLYGVVRRTPPEKSVWLQASTKDDGLTWSAPVPTSRQFYTDIPDSPYPLELPGDLKNAVQ